MFTYLLYGMVVVSDIELPGVPLFPRPIGYPVTHVLIRHANDGECIIAAGSLPGLTVFPDPGQDFMRLYWRSVGMFELHIGSPHELVYRAMPGVELAVVGAFILNNALNVLLMSDPSRFLLHASAVRLKDGRGIALAGRSGVGKSTLAATLIERGHTLLADDITIVDMHSLHIFPAFPQLKLHQDSAQALGIRPDDTQYLPSNAKRLYPATAQFASNSAPLHTLYILDDDDCPLPTFEPPYSLSVVAASYNAHIGQLLKVDIFMTTTQARAFMTNCSTLTWAIEIKRLKRPRDLARLHEVATLIESDVV